MGKLRVALGDLRHRTGGRNFVFMPLGIGAIGACALSRLGTDRLEVRLHDDPDALLRDLHTWRPHVLGLSNYCWNAELSRLVFTAAKEGDPGILTVSGGPEFPLTPAESEAYFRGRPETDLYLYLEGELSFAATLADFLRDRDIVALRSAPRPGTAAIHPRTRKLVMGPPMPRLADLDAVPSPYLTGLMDRFFDGTYAPSIETARGCPFTCGFCFAGQEAYGRVARASAERVKAELDYIAGRMKRYPDMLLSICDSNFGMYEQDEETARHCRRLQDRLGWPQAFDVTTGKAHYDRILRIAAILKNRMQVTCSTQSFNPRTLSVIRRRNLPPDEFQAVLAELKARKMLSVAELIMPLPKETRTSYLKGVRTLLDAGVESVVPYTTMLLKGTFLASRPVRKAHRMKTAFRVLPRQFGEYNDRKCFEVEEVCVATADMPFSDYLDLRGFGLVSAFFSCELFDAVLRHLKEHDLSPYTFYHALWQRIASGKTPLSKAYAAFIAETRAELRPSANELRRFYSRKGNYRRLLTGELGDNLIRKYRTRLLMDHGTAAIRLAYGFLLRSVDPAAREGLAAAERWLTASRDLAPVFTTGAYRGFDQSLRLPYDVPAWYASAGRPLAEFRKPVVCRLSYDADRIASILAQGERLYGKELGFRVGKLLTNWSLQDFWCRCRTENDKMTRRSS
ncbi:MAG: radical SAM protein [Elusimicrobiota bacterium]|jgi:radical SAM superfamily enzyme YgiQ (UPF0313 family)